VIERKLDGRIDMKEDDEGDVSRYRMVLRKIEDTGN
jgi:hypothetical protein